MADAFWDRGFVIAQDLIDASQVAFVHKAMDFSRSHQRMADSYGVVPEKALDEYAPLAAERLLRHLRAAIEAIVGRELLESYAYWRIYDQGARLKRHVDRPACEVTATLMIHADPAEPVWPICVKDLAGTQHEVQLRPGSAVVYQGHRIEHWRTPYTGTAHYQMFLHYVFKDGAFAAYHTDQRGFFEG